MFVGLDCRTRLKDFQASSRLAVASCKIPLMVLVLYIQWILTLRTSGQHRDLHGFRVFRIHAHAA